MSANDAAVAALLEWYEREKRDLPWRGESDPYRIWISEIMLQQTRVETVKGYYARFLERFPTGEALARAPLQDVLKLWEGLGYYSRARHLHEAARVIWQSAGAFPNSWQRLRALPGVGDYTAGAVASIAFGERVPAVDGNVRRVASRFFGVRESVESPAVQRALRALVADTVPEASPGRYNQALMELGATLCAPVAPKCELCPWQPYCDACAEGDADSLPVHEKKRPPKAVDVAVCLLTLEGRVLVARRRERMLGGLYVFMLIEDETDPARVRERLCEIGFRCGAPRALGQARHVFTHRTWEMLLYQLALLEPPDERLLEELDARLVTLPEMEALPFPAAMRAARDAARRLLGGEGVSALGDAPEQQPL